MTMGTSFSNAFNRLNSLPRRTIANAALVTDSGGTWELFGFRRHQSPVPGKELTYRSVSRTPAFDPRST